MSEQDRFYIAIDLKSFYASVECVERELNPLTTNLVVADISRTEKTICLAVSPSLKSYGIPGRARLFEVIQKIKEANIQRQIKAPGGKFTDSSWDDEKLKISPSTEIDFIAATPQMALYLDYSTRIYDIYLKYAAPEDIHVYSIDEVFIDVTQYLNAYGVSAEKLAKIMICDIYNATGIIGTAGVGTNLYLSKIAMDIVAKQMEEDESGVRVAVLDEMSYRKMLWTHQPLTDFWRVGRGYSKKLKEKGLYTMGDIARCSIGGTNDYHNEDLLYKMFGVNAELLIDHAWGWEPCTMSDIKAYKPENNSTSSGQVLMDPYDSEKAKLIVKEMTDLLALDLVDKGLVTDQMVLTIGYDISNFKDPKISNSYTGEITTDYYGRKKPKHAHGTANLDRLTSSAKLITDAVIELFDRIIDKNLTVRRVTLTANHIKEEASINKDAATWQLDMLTDYDAARIQNEKEQYVLEREKRRQQAILNIKKKFGKNAVIKGMNLEEGATTLQRNKQIGGHKE